MSRHGIASLNVLLILSALSGGTAGVQSLVLFPGSTAPGDILRGWGVAAIGEGLYNVNTAAACSIEADTCSRLNQYLCEARREQARRQDALEARQRVRLASASREIAARVADRPEPRDVHRGDSLNALARAVAAMNAHPSAARATRVGVPAGTLQELPLVHAPSQAVVSLARLDVRDRWPLLLRTPALAAARGRYEAALDSTRLGLLDRRISPQVLDELDRAVEGLAASLRPVAGSAQPDEAGQARSFLARLSRTTELLRDPRVAGARADVLGYLGTDVADLLAFLRRHDLRFAPAEAPAERELLEDLHALLAEHRRKLALAVEARRPDDSVPPPAGSDPASELGRSGDNDR